MPTSLLIFCLCSLFLSLLDTLGAFADQFLVALNFSQEVEDMSVFLLFCHLAWFLWLLADGVLWVCEGSRSAFNDVLPVQWVEGPSCFT